MRRLIVLVVVSSAIWSACSSDPDAVGSGDLTCAPGGLTGQYFDNIDFTGLKVTRVDETIAFGWGYGSPDPSIGTDTFSVRWTGQISAPTSETYTFYTRSDDGVRLWIDGRLVIGNWSDHPPTWNSGTIALVAGARVDVKMELYERTGGAVAQLEWSSPSVTRQVVPSSALFPAPCTAPSDGGTAPVPGLLAAYDFEEGSGTTTADRSGHGHPGSLSGPTWTTAGRYGGALSFDGIDDWVTIADHAELDLTAAVTLEAWIKPTVASGFRAVILKEQPGELVYALYASNGSTGPEGIAFTGGAERRAIAPSPAATGVWAHLAMTYDGSASRLYVNGVLAATQAASGPMPTSTLPLRLGGNAVWGEYLSGLIDDVRVYNRALAASEIQTDMATPVGSAAPPPPMDAGTPAVDGGTAPIDAGTVPIDSGPAPSGSPTVWLSTTGDDATCARGDSSRPCRTFNRAYGVARCGDVVEIRAGTWSSETIGADTTKATCTSHVVFRPAAGAAVRVDHLSLEDTDWVYVRDFAVNQIDLADGTTHATVDRIDGGSFFLAGASDVVIQDSDWGPCNSSGTGACSQNWIVPSAGQTRNIMIRRNKIHDYDIVRDGDHFECMFVTGADGLVTMDSNWFYNCETYDIYFSSWHSEHTYALASFVIQNNWFGRTCCFTASDRGSAINLGGASVAPDNLLFRFNSFADGQAIVREGGLAGTNNRAVGNIFGTTDCVSDVQYDYNLFKGSSTCGTNGRAIGSMPYVNNNTSSSGDYHLAGAAGSTPADDFVRGTGAPFSLATDRDGDARSTTARECGSDER